MFGKNKQKMRRTYDELLLEDINRAKQSWDNKRETQQSIYGIGEEIDAEVELEKAKYQLLFREARRRKIKGKLQASVIKINEL